MEFNRVGICQDQIQLICLNLLTSDVKSCQIPPFVTDLVSYYSLTSLLGVSCVLPVSPAALVVVKFTSVTMVSWNLWFWLTSCQLHTTIFIIICTFLLNLYHVLPRLT